MIISGFFFSFTDSFKHRIVFPNKIIDNIINKFSKALNQEKANSSNPIGLKTSPVLKNATKPAITTIIKDMTITLSV